MKMLTAPILKKLLDNGEKSRANPAFASSPVVKFFLPSGGATWLIADLDPEDHDRAFGLCDLGLGSPELGYVSLRELFAVRGRFGLGVERDRHWKPAKTLAEYARDANDAGRIVT